MSLGKPIIFTVLIPLLFAPLAPAQTSLIHDPGAVCAYIAEKERVAKELLAKMPPAAPSLPNGLPTAHDDKSNGLHVVTITAGTKTMIYSEEFSGDRLPAPERSRRLLLLKLGMASADEAQNDLSIRCDSTTLRIVTEGDAVRSIEIKGLIDLTPG